MQSSLSWIEWIDRLHRVLEGARQDVRLLKRVGSADAREAVERCQRQLSALTNELRLLDRSVLRPRAGSAQDDRADNLQRALDTTVFQLDKIIDAPESAPPVARERLISAIEWALRDSAREAEMLLGPSQRRA